MKQILYILAWPLIISGCQNADTKPVAAQAAEDSLHIYPRTPAALDQQTYRRYYRMLNQFFDSTLIDKGFNGAILVAKDGQVLYEKYIGYRNLHAKDSLTDTTSFHLASTSKPFTAMALLRLVQEGKLSLEDSLQKFFPAFPYRGISVKMLMNHRSGLPNYVYFVEESKKWDKKKYLTNEDLLQFMYQEKPARSFPPGKRFSYSNTNYVLMAMIIEKITGQDFPAYMKQQLFDPLQMKHTFVFTLADTAHATASFQPNGRIWDNDFLEATYGDKNIYSTPQDMLKWDQALYNEAFISKPLLDSAFAPYSFEKPGTHNYGLGWRMLLIPNGKKVIYHFGRWHGFTPAFARLTDEKVAIIILGNKFNRHIYTAAHLAYDLFGEYQQRQENVEE
ncbi:MAG TPA: serine hydrolase domain-containing protein [Chitinophagaceae bacterium]|nr:serine hydrolase domain-containing protein [Chitinophagaceae bacterium]